MTEASPTRFKRHRFPAEIIAHAVWLYFRFPLGLRDVEDLLAERGIHVSFQTVAEWAAKFGLKFAQRWRRLNRVRGAVTPLARTSRGIRQSDFTSGREGASAKLAMVCGGQEFPVKKKQIGDLAVN